METERKISIVIDVVSATLGDPQNARESFIKSLTEPPKLLPNLTFYQNLLNPYYEQEINRKRVKELLRTKQAEDFKRDQERERWFRNRRDEQIRKLTENFKKGRTENES